MAVEMIGDSGMEYQLKQTYDHRLLMRATKDLVYNRYAEKKPIPKRGGKSIEFRRLEKLTMTNGSYTLTEGTYPAETQATYSKVECTISQYGQWSKISDVLNFQGFDPVIADFVDLYGDAMGEGLDNIPRDALSSCTTIQYADSATVVGTSGAGAVGSGNFMDAAELLEARRTLRRNGAKPAEDGKFVCFLHPDNTKDLYEDSDILEAFKDAAPRDSKNPIFTGVLGDWMGMRFVETNNLRIRSSYGMSGADVYECHVFGKGAYGTSDLSAMAARTIIHPASIAGGPLEQYSTVGWKAALGACLLNNDFIVQINCGSSRSLSA